MLLLWLRTEEQHLQQCGTIQLPDIDMLAAYPLDGFKKDRRNGSCTYRSLYVTLAYLRPTERRRAYMQLQGWDRSRKRHPSCFFIID
jgi:hypothetical protein